MAGGLVYDKRLGSPQGMGAIILAQKGNFCDPFVNKAGILPCADVGRVFGAAGKGVILQGSTLELKPFDEAERASSISSN